MKNTIITKAKYFKDLQRRIYFPFNRNQVKKNALFIHIPKTAGTSIINAFGKHRGGRNHLHWYVYETANPTYFNDAFKFAFVRDPIDRIRSAYNYIKRGGNNTTDTELSNIFQRFESFESFVIEGFGVGLCQNHILFEPQTNFIFRYDNTCAVDFIGRYERFKEDYQYVARTLDLPLSPPELNRSHKNPSGENLSAEAIEILQTHYNIDYDLLGY